LVEVDRSIDTNVPKAWKLFEVNYSTWNTLDGLLECLRSVSVLATLITYVELWRGDLMEEGDLRTCLSLEDCVDMRIATLRDYLDMGVSMALGSMVEDEA
jgi:hypothetical protein